MNNEDIFFSEIRESSSESSSGVIKTLRFSCTNNALNAWGGIDMMLPIIGALKIKDPDFHARMQLFYSALNRDGTLGGRCSSSILLDLFFGAEFIGLNPFAVIAEIKLLDQQKTSQTKQATRFRGNYLAGLWHKHYMNGDVASLAQNVQNALKEYGIPFFDQKIRESQAAREEQFITKEDVEKIVTDLVTNNLARRRREGKMTGEWIIYVRHKEQNFYLCLAKHNDEDREILAKIKRACVHEFPFLNEVLR